MKPFFFLLSLCFAFQVNAQTTNKLSTPELFGAEIFEACQKNSKGIVLKQLSPTLDDMKEKIERSALPKSEKKAKMAAQSKARPALIDQITDSFVAVMNRAKVTGVDWDTALLDKVEYTIKKEGKKEQIVTTVITIHIKTEKATYKIETATCHELDRGWVMFGPMQWKG